MLIVPSETPAHPAGVSSDGLYRLATARRAPIVGKLDPNRRVIARVLPGPHMALGAGGDQAAGKGRAQQQVIDAQTSVTGKCVPEYFQNV